MDDVTPQNLSNLQNVGKGIYFFYFRSVRQDMRGLVCAGQGSDMPGIGQ
jgi:hypothetical protein